MGDYPSLSLWHETAGDPFVPRPPLPGDRTVDVAIVGAGYTGLWTAWYLLERQPGLRIAIIEREVAGFGASGRNGGWCSSIFPASWKRIAREAGRAAVGRLQEVLDRSVDEVGRVAATAGIDCDFQRGGYVSVARNPAQWARARAEVESARAWGIGEGTVRLLSAAEATARIAASGVLGGTYVGHCAAIHPAKLVRGLARAVEARGGTIYERTAATGISAGRVETSHGVVTAGSVVLAIEGYTPDFPGRHREMVPMYSLMVATEPLDPAVWSRIGLADRETFSDKRHLRIYGQRTADGRIAFGGRGAPYHFGSRVRAEYDRDPAVHAMLRDVLLDLLPDLPRGVHFTHAWGGNLGIPRDWFPSVSFDQASRIGVAGGYVGDGVALSNVAGRALADLIGGVTSETTALPFVGRRSPRWEPEPFRWVGVNAVTGIFRGADRAEARTGRPSRRAAWFWRALGH
ncbi:MAG: FAD-dependent oxidoreductase [Gemmatimonadales bacterium]|nr:FAD-dependent oxidoreductase [Gemmatimonadales bacterium]